MSDEKDDSGQRAFEMALATSGLQLAPHEVETMREGYRGLQLLLARLPRDIAMEAEPATIAVPPGARSTR